MQIHRDTLESIDFQNLPQNYWSPRKISEFFSIFLISWRLIILQYCSGFCHTLTWISLGYTCIPHPNSPSHLPLHPNPVGLPSAPGQSTCLKHCYSTNAIVPKKNFMISGGNWTCIFVPARTLWERKVALLKIYHHNRHKWDHSGKSRIICEYNITLHFGIALKKNFNLGTSFRCTAKLNRRYKEFLFTHSLHTYSLPQLTICGIFVKINILTLTIIKVCSLHQGSLLVVYILCTNV